MEGAIQKSELKLELSCCFDSYDVKREGYARKSPQKLLRDLKQLQIQRNQ